MMCKKSLLFIALMLFAGWSFAADFQPNFMELTVPDMIQYDFDGTNMEIDLNIAGVGGTYYLVISTHEQGENIGWVQNGHLGWHTVNKIDTTISLTGPFQRGTGSNSITWDGTDQDGGQVPGGTYKFLIWGYDHVNSRIPVTKYICAEYGWKSHFTYIIENDENGVPLSNPIICGSMHHQNVVDDVTYLQAGVQKKWVVGGDPDDQNNLLWTKCDIYPPNSERGNPGFKVQGLSVYNPYDQDIFYHCHTDIDNAISTMLKWAFVNEGRAVQDESWGGYDNITWDEKVWSVWIVPKQSTIKDDVIYVNAADQTGVVDGDYTWLRAVDYDGEELFEKQMMEFFMPDDPNPVEAQNCAQLDAAPGAMPNQLFLGTMGCCMHEMIHTANILEDSGVDEDEYLVWRNSNGDFFFDTYWQADAVAPWACLNNSEYESHRIDSVATDSNGFNFIWSTYTGVYSFGVSCPDGTMIGMMQLNDDAVYDVTKNNGGGHIVDSGSAYDGMYMVRTNAEGQVHAWAEPETHWVAYDSASGLISSEVAVDEESAVAFAVEQNAPNPFNPSTSIGFTIPEAGHVSLDIFNIAGQKVVTLVDDALSAGHHTVTWDASGVSNGVYFYTVNAGEYSKTMKMTLLK